MMGRLRAAGTLSTVAMVAMAWLLPGTAHASELHIKEAEQGKCLDIVGDSPNDGAPLQRFTCKASENQLWDPIQVRSRVWLLRNPHTGRCVTAESGAFGAAVVMHPCDGNNLAQQWIASGTFGLGGGGNTLQSGLQFQNCLDTFSNLVKVFTCTSSGDRLNLAQIWAVVN
ncbi:RICIN domain-containing protein [Actinomadura barringtoniae]|uniref:RICIN domain-containing protein n=1 Tax=Actinomadura barringtoniae TaxID=1427535 RepID=A0A939PHP7_9ACTN|nr:RICIN domain-containing protein [Actinomadura barringtoniae]MBO2452413.1 RICIN domain-containing protein [Actinomadura barringtoniae]